MSSFNPLGSEVKNIAAAIDAQQEQAHHDPNRPKRVTIGFSPAASSPSVSSASPESPAPPGPSSGAGVTILQRGVPQDIKNYKSQIVGWSNEEIRTPVGMSPPSAYSRSPGRASFEDRMASQYADQRGRRGSSSETPNTSHKRGSTASASTALGIDVTASSDQQKKKPTTKAERRALQEAQRAAKAAKQNPQPQGGSSSSKGKGPANAQENSSSVANAPASSASGAADKRKAKKPVAQAPENSVQKKTVPFFEHLPQFDGATRLTHHLRLKGKEVVLHPVILQLGLQYAHMNIVGANARCLAMLKAFRQVIMDYKTPPSIALSRHLEQYLKPHINYLTQVRHMSVGMGNAIRSLKLEIADIRPETPEDDAKRRLIEYIDNYKIDRILGSACSIAQTIVKGRKINNGDVILTYANSSTVEKVLIHAHQQNIKFKVIVVDSRPSFEGKKLLKRLITAGLKCSYVLLNTVGFVMKEVSKVFIGAHAVLNNGAVMSRAGTAMVAMLAYDSRIPVIVCAETYKFTERLLLDSIVMNELGDPDALIDLGDTREPILSNWRDMENLKVLNLLYDVTPAQYVSTVISEWGMLPPTSVPVVLREKDLKRAA